MADFPGNSLPLTATVRIPVPRLRRIAYFALTLSTTAFGVALMFDILNANGMTVLEAAVLVLFAINFGWIAMAFWTAAIGFTLQLCGLDPLSLRRSFDRGAAEALLSTRTAVVMPVYNEDVERVMAGFAATYRDLQNRSEGAAFDFYLLSDTTDDAIARTEEAAWRTLRRQLHGASGLYYRRRDRNEGRKAGNVAEFCRRWGAYYDFLIVLDADSIMTGGAIMNMVRAMEANPAAGIIQTVPIPVRQSTLFGRFLQFASSLYSPMLATGLCFWQTDTVNFWGHNAILRIDAFMAHCGLPTLPGDPPLGGEILSHDFVESALIRRGGWLAYLLTEIEGSYEELPGNALDYAKRDRRWAEGNVQHLRLLTAPGLHPLSRLHFVMGALAYGCSLLWLMILVVGTADAVGRSLRVHEFFTTGTQLFPNWPLDKTPEMFLLLCIVVALLLLPKLLGVVVALLQARRRRAFGGGPRLLVSALMELIFSVMISPIMMCFHAWFVASVLAGFRVTWGPQPRDGRQIGMLEALRSTWLVSVAGIVWGIGTWSTTPIFFWALTPVIFGLVTAGPLVSISSREDLGLWLRRLGLLSTRAETDPPAVLCTVARHLVRGVFTSGVAGAADSADDPLRLLPDRPRRMPVQSLARAQVPQPLDDDTWRPGGLQRVPSPTGRRSR